MLLVSVDDQTFKPQSYIDTLDTCFGNKPLAALNQFT